MCIHIYTYIYIDTYVYIYIYTYIYIHIYIYMYGYIYIYIYHILFCTYEFCVYLHVDSQKDGSLGVKNPLDLRRRTLQPLAKARAFHGAMEVAQLDGLQWNIL